MNAELEIKTLGLLGSPDAILGGSTRCKRKDIQVLEGKWHSSERVVLRTRREQKYDQPHHLGVNSNLGSPPRRDGRLKWSQGLEYRGGGSRLI